MPLPSTHNCHPEGRAACGSKDPGSNDDFAELGGSGDYTEAARAAALPDGM